MKSLSGWLSWLRSGQGAPGGLVLSLLVAHAAFGAEGRVPAPSRALHPAANSVVYLDLTGVRQSGVWPAMAAQFKRLGAMLEGAGADGQPMIPGVDLGPLSALGSLDTTWLRELENLEFAEILLVGESDLAATDPSKLGANDGFLLVTRLARPLEDQEALVGRILAAMDQLESGLGDRVAGSRKRVGAAESFLLPINLLAQQEIPFPVSLAVGPGEQGSVLAVGRTDRLERFLEGKTSGEMPRKVTGLMPRRGQLWAYSAIPPNASRMMTAAAPPEMAGMGADLFKVVDSLRDLGLNLSFGATAVDVQVLLGCTGSDVASQMAQQVGGMLGILQMMGGGQAPAFVSRLRAAATGNIFTLATSVTPKDLDQLAQSMPGGATSGARTVGSGTEPATGRVVVRLPADHAPPVDVEFLQLKPNEGGHLRHGRLRLQNRSDQAVRELRLVYDYLNARGSRVGTWTRQQGDPMSDTLVRAGATREIDVPLFNIPLSTERVSVSVREVVFADGKKWVAPR